MSAASPNPVDFGEHHVGEVLSQLLSISNTGTVDGFTEKLDAGIGGTTGAADANGAFSGLAAGVTNSSSLMVGLNSSKDGAQSGTETITLTSDGAGIDTLGTTVLAAQTITVEGTLYNYATASVAAPDVVNFGDRHVGDVLSQALSISNLGTADRFTENLDASIGGVTGALSANGSSQWPGGRRHQQQQPDGRAEQRAGGRAVGHGDNRPDLRWSRHRHAGDHGAGCADRHGRRNTLQLRHGQCGGGEPDRLWYRPRRR